MRDEGLPVFTCPTPEDLQENDHAISCLLPNEASKPQRRLLLAFDRTYVQATTQLLQTTKGHVMAGGVYRCPGFAQPDESQILVKRQNEPAAGPVTITRTREKASEVCSCLIWDVSRPHSTFYETAAWPCVPAANQHEDFEKLATNPKVQRGQFEVMNLIGQVLANSPSIRFVMSDRHGSHGWLASTLLGRRIDLCDELFEKLPFFNKLRWVQLPECKWPIPYRVTMINGCSIHFVPGPAHSQKAFAEQLRTCLHTPCFDLLWSDFAASLDLGLAPAAFCGMDTMSDAQGALLCLRFASFMPHFVSGYGWIMMD